MAVTISKAIPCGPTAYMLRFSSDQSDPVFYVYRNGKYQGKTTHQSRLIQGAIDEAVVVEIFDNAAHRPAYASPALADLLYQAAANNLYLIEVNDGGWQLVQAVQHQNVSQVLRPLLTPIGSSGLPIRITRVSPAGAEASPANLTITFVRHPDTPEVEHSYSSGTGKVTISAA